MSHFVSSRDGLFVFDKTLTKILDGKFFGMAHYNSVWYIFGFEGDIYSGEKTGKIYSFRYQHDGVLTDLKTHASGLDNGCHQMTIYKNHIYILETYLQRVVKIPIEGTGFEYIYPWKSAVNSHYEGPNEDYMHVNAITIHDGRFFVMCPNLKNETKKETSKIQVFSYSWQLLDEYQLDRWFCHDLVPLGHEIYFCDALNTICRLNIVTRQVFECVQLRDTPPNDTRSIFRGLSINKDGHPVVSSFYNGFATIVNLVCDEYYRVELDCSATFITRIDGEDYNNSQSSLRRPYVLTLDRASLSFFKDQADCIDEMFDTIYEEDWLIKPRWEGAAPTLENFLNPLLDSDQPYIDHREAVCIRDQSSCKLRSLMNSNVFCSHLMEMSGFFYYYPLGHGLGWHSNEKHIRESPGMSFRCYTIRTTGGTFFFYKHPVSQKIHAVHDIDKTVNIFHLTPMPNSFWHAVGTFAGRRFSIGFRSGVLGLKDVGVSKDDIIQLF